MQSFAPSALASAISRDVNDAGVLTLRLTGEIGAGGVTSAGVRRQLVLRDFRHLHMEICSTGGDSAEAFSIYEMLRAQPVPVSARASLRCCSAAMVVYLAADLRIAAAATEFLIHPASTARETLPERPTALQLKHRSDVLAAVDLRIARLLSDRTGEDLDWFAAEQLTEDVLDMVDAIERGIVHEVEGLAGEVDVDWPRVAEQIAHSRVQHVVPRRMLTPSYLAACRCAASLRRKAEVES